MQELDHKQEGLPDLPHAETAQSLLFTLTENHMKDDQATVQGFGNTISSRPRSNYKEINIAPRCGENSP